jgi:hypothetical protein
VQVFPVLVGSRGSGHDGDCRSYTEVRGGGGCFPKRPSPPSARAAGQMLLGAAGLARAGDAARAARRMSVLEAVEAIEAQPG